MTFTLGLPVPIPIWRYSRLLEAIELLYLFNKYNTVILISYYAMTFEVNPKAD